LPEKSDVGISKADRCKQIPTMPIGQFGIAAIQVVVIFFLKTSWGATSLI
jgi:hypothetical protein